MLLAPVAGNLDHLKSIQNKFSGWLIITIRNNTPEKSSNQGALQCLFDETLN